jgi:hypothetical protein
MKEQFKMDRSLVVAQSFEEANNHTNFYDNKSIQERVNAACFIIYNIYGTNQQTKVDRTIVSKRKHENR